MGFRRFKTYYVLTKPGIIYGNVLNALAGFLLAAAVARHIDFVLMIKMVFGLALVIASGCVFNNFIDRNIDSKMARTKRRALVRGTVNTTATLVYASCLGIVGFVVLILFTNRLTVLMAAIGFVDYIILYGYWKRHSIHGTLVGSISGAMPPLVGYCAFTNHFDGAAAILFFILVLWQMPHFYAIALYRQDDYVAAGIPVWPAVKGVRSTKIQILGYVLAFLATACMLTVFGYTGLIYLVVVIGVAGLWMRLAIKGFYSTDDKKWARQMFFFSLIVTLVLTVMIPLGALLP